MKLIRDFCKIIHSDTYKNLPILGINGTGKTYFLVTLGYFVSKKRWGEVDTDTSDYFHSCLEKVLQGKPIDYSPHNTPIAIKIKKISRDAENIDCNFILSSQDIPGRKFLNAMTNRLIGNRSSSEIKERDPRTEFFLGSDFSKLYSNSDGIIVIVDIVRDSMTADIFKKNKDELILNAFSEQITPIIRGIEFILKENINVKGKPILFVFTKADVHQLSLEEISNYFDQIMALILARLENRGVVINKYTISAMGWGSGKTPLDRLGILESKGYTDLLYDLAKLYNKR